MNEHFQIMEKVSVASNIIYKSIDSINLALDVYFPAKNLGEDPWNKISEDFKPTLIYFHGGGWIEGDRISRFLGLLPFLEKGWCVVNVDYRLLSDTDLIGSLNDCIDATNWVKTNASIYKFDLEQIYLSGESAGGHLALLTGMFKDKEIEGVGIHKQMNKIKGIINWYGITDMEPAIKFWNDSAYTNLILDKWNGNVTEYYKATSPINHISEDTPPIITIHGDADINVEFSQAMALHEQLDAGNIKNQLIRVKGKKHGNFSADELANIFDTIWSFLE
ncbi:MAG: alpha/beta hydrolase [Leptolyngbya sp. SIO3F4]|nr:alpha/beta hydrolase [Leptolyngbya sp. SIO3F4]